MPPKAYTRQAEQWVKTVDPARPNKNANKTRKELFMPWYICSAGVPLGMPNYIEIILPTQECSILMPRTKDLTSKELPDPYIPEAFDISVKREGVKVGPRLTS